MHIEYERHLRFMQVVYHLSKQVQEEVPISAAVVLNNKIVGTGNNKMIQLKDPTYHAEIEALKNASSTIHNTFLQKCTLYTTQEPCIMCVQSIINYKIKKIVYASSSDNKTKLKYFKHLVKTGSLNMVINIEDKKCKKNLRDFFILLKNGLINSNSC